MTSPYATYQEHLSRSELAYQVDSDGRPVFYPRVAAPGSGATDLRWRVSRGLGTVHSSTVIFRKGEPPLNVSLIDVDEGFRMMSRVDGVPAESVFIGQRVTLRVLPATDAADALPVFVPLEQLP